LLTVSIEDLTYIEVQIVVWNTKISMELPTIVRQLLAAKQKQGLSFADLEKILDRDEVWIAAALYRQAAMSEDEAKLLVEALDLDASYLEQLTAYPIKGLGSIVPTDPLIYRFYEIIQVYGFPLKSVIQEKFGDGIMSAIDFTMNIDKEVDPNGDRVKLTMSGKFLPYKKW
jgi:cyanate lyase